MTDTDILHELPGVDLAEAEFQRLLADDTNAAHSATPPPPETPAVSANTGQRAAQEEGGASQTTTETETDTRAAAKPEAGEPQKPQTESKADPEAGQGEAERKSKYERDAERLPKSWKAFNAEKEATRAQQEAAAKALAEREQALAAREAEIEREAQGVTPEAYEAHAARLLQQAKKLGAQADAAEDAGKFDEARRLRKQAQRDETYAEDALEAAETARKHPVSDRRKAYAERQEAERREWLGKAYVDFPDLARPDGALQKAARDILASVPEHIRREPYAAYLAVDIAAAKLAATRVPGLLKEVERQKARIAQLEKATSPGGAGNPILPAEAPATMEQMSATDLQRMMERAAKDNAW